LLNSFNGYALWLPDLYNRLALYTEHNPDHTLTICEVVTALANSTAVTDTFVRSTELMNVNSTEGRTVNGTWGLNNTAACSSTVDPTVFRNSLAIGLVCITVYTCASFVVKFIKKKPLMGKLNDVTLAYKCLCVTNIGVSAPNCETHV
jgi:hypothetical protein